MVSYDQQVLTVFLQKRAMNCEDDWETWALFSYGERSSLYQQPKFVLRGSDK